jgi:glycosyltransferase involved in cell wall biosynthesis
VTGPRVSVVVPCWNAGPFLPGLLASLDAQLFRDFEIIITDDGSTDPATLDELAALPKTVHLVRQENRGLPGARNAGFRAATGELVLPLDCDDRIEPGFLAEAVARLDADPALDFVFSHMRLTGARTGVLERSFNRFDQLFLNQLPYSLLMRRSAWERVGGYDETMRAGYEDWDFNLRLITSGSAGALIPKPLFVYHVAEGGMLLSRSARRHGELWSRIRSKHPDAYRLSNLVRLHRTEGTGKLSLPIASTLLAAAMLLPNPWFGSLYQRALAGRIRRRAEQNE